MPKTTFDVIVSKYVETDMAYHFMNGNGLATRICPNLIYKCSLKKMCGLKANKQK